MLKSEAVGVGDLRALGAEADRYNLALAAVINRRMTQSGLVYRDLALRTAITEATMWNRLHTGGLRPSEQFKIAHALGTTVAELAADALEHMAEEGRS